MGHQVKGWSILLLFTVIVAGCAEPAAPSVAPTTSVAPPASVTVETGGLEGLVTDDQVVPVPDVEVGIGALELRTRTDAEGRYSFSDLPPGAHEVAFGRLGFAQVAKRVDVLAGVVAWLNVTLLPQSVVPAAYVESFSRVSFIEFGTGNSHSQALWRLGQGCSACKHPLLLPASVQQMMLEYVFKPTIDYPAYDEKLYYSLYRNTTDNAPSSLTHEYITSGFLLDHGQKILASPTEIKRGENRITLYVGGGNDPYVTYQQKVDAWISFAHNGPLPEGHTAAPPKA